MLSGKNDKNKSSRKKQNFPALRDENCNREEPVQKPSRIFSWRSGHQPERSFFPRTRFRIPCSVRLTGILRTDTDKTDIVRLSVCPTDVPNYIYQGVPTKGSKKSISNTNNQPVSQPGTCYFEAPGYLSVKGLGVSSAPCCFLIVGLLPTVCKTSGLPQHRQSTSF